jgi:hypothetical protein
MISTDAKTYPLGSASDSYKTISSTPCLHQENTMLLFTKIRFDKYAKAIETLPQLQEFSLAMFFYQ